MAECLIKWLDQYWQDGFKGDPRAKITLDQGGQGIFKDIFKDFSQHTKLHCVSIGKVVLTLTEQTKLPWVNVSKVDLNIAISPLALVALWPIRQYWSITSTKQWPNKRLTII